MLLPRPSLITSWDWEKKKHDENGINFVFFY